MSKENRTTLRLGIDRTIQPKQYEPIKIQVSIEEDFIWENEKDRSKKMKTYRDRILEDFVTTFNEVVKKIGEESRCIGRVVTSGDVNIPEPIAPTIEEIAETDVSKDDEFDFNFD